MENRLIEAADRLRDEEMHGPAYALCVEDCKTLTARVKELERTNEQLREVVRQQGEFIQSMREMIRDFVYGQDASLGRLRRAHS